MLPKDTLTCELIPNAVKNGSLSCSVPPLEHLQMWSTIGDVATAVLTAVLAGLALWAGRTAVKTLNQTRKNSIDQTRPYVYVQVTPSIAGESAYDLIVQNSGQSTAKDLVITCPEFPKNPDHIAEAVGRLLGRQLVLPPGTRIRSFWHFSGKNEQWNDKEGDLGLPPVAHVHVSYSGPDGTYTDIFPVDIGVYAMTPVGARGRDVPPGLSDSETDLHKMLAAIAGNISNLGR